jgi:uncharacterized protein with PQ loop repeat
MNLVREIAGVVMTVCFMFCYIPQIVKMHKNKSSRDVSLGLVFMSMGGYFAGMVYLFTGEFGLWWFMNYCSGIIMCTILIHAWYKYRK